MKEKRSLKSYLEALLTSKNLNIVDCDETLQYTESRLNCTILKIITLANKLHENSAINEITPDLIRVSANNILSNSILKNFEQPLLNNTLKEPLDISLEWLTLTGRINNPNTRTDIYTNKDVLIKNYVKHDLSSEHMKLLSILKNKIQTHDNIVKAIIKKEHIIEQLVPYLISYLTNRILTNLSKIPLFDLECLESISYNTKISSEYYLQQSLPLILTCLLNKQIVKTVYSLKSKEHQNAVKFISISVNILMAVIKKYSLTYPELETKIIYKLKQIICEEECYYNLIGCFWVLKKLIYNIFEFNMTLYDKIEEVLKSKDKVIVKETREYLMFVNENFELNIEEKNRIKSLLNK